MEGDLKDSCKSGNCFIEMFKCVDMYGVPISLNFRGKTHFQTTFGAFVSILSFIAVTWYTSTQLVQVYGRGGTFISTNTVSKNLINDSSVHNIGQKGFHLSIGGASRHLGAPMMILDPRYMNVEFNYHEAKASISNGGLTNDQKSKSIGTKRCGTNSSFPLDPEIITSLGLHQFWCPNSSEWGIGGTQMGLFWKYLEVKIRRCELASGCKSTTEINNYLKDQVAFVGVTNQYFDGGDYHDPIKEDLQNDFFYHFIDNYIVEKNIKIRLNKVVDYTNLLYEFGPREYSYFSVDSVDDSLQQDDGSGDLMRFRIVLDHKYTSTERRVYTFYDMLGQIGGFLGILLSVGNLLSGLISKNIFMMTLLSSLFKVEKDKSSQKIVPHPSCIGKPKCSKVYKFSKSCTNFFQNKNFVEESKNENSEEEKYDDGSEIKMSHYPNELNNEIRQFQLSNFRKHDHYNNYNDTTLDPLAGSSFDNKHLLRKVEEKIESRVWYKFKWKNLYYSIVCCKGLYKGCSKSLHTQNQQYKAAATKVEAALDVKTLIKSMRKTQILSEIIMPRSASILLDNHRSGVLPPEDEETSKEEVDLDNPVCRYLALKMIGRDISSCLNSLQITQTNY
ncbi:unnamed protein product [Moneuplotes crassus]|uniref:Uncharacterized protein n=1 Tax=Euplotes crassus TaxID=5936 RepID=A0AAD1U9U8_EUPCR|nr:unnamed protein product [Moneuplotes crassus]